ncbi:MAG: malate synthase G [Porticoccaceae bacterium]|nr:malate synthase G [Porticoccaceae bacterium]
MDNYYECGDIKVAYPLYDFVSKELCVELGLDSTLLWEGLSRIITSFVPRNTQLLTKREKLQFEINQWHLKSSKPKTPAQHKAFLKEIGYICAEVPDFNIAPKNVDSEIAFQAAPQLVVPISNARFAINAVNARWGSLYDALYGNDVISEAGGAEKGTSYNPLRGRKVIDYGKGFLDSAVPLLNALHRDVTKYFVRGKSLIMMLQDQREVTLVAPEQWIGYTGDRINPSIILLNNNGLHIEIHVDNRNEIGANDVAGVSDIILESAVTTILDFEDSVAIVDPEDKVLGYRNLMGLLKGTLTENVQRGSYHFERKLASDRCYLDRTGHPLVLKGRALMFIRNVGHLMTSSAVLYGGNKEIPEGILDIFMSCLIGMYDLCGKSPNRNSEKGSLYIVKPKMHGPEEVEFTDDLFNAMENLFKIPRHTIKVGIMDEERRTSLNLKACIEKVKDRVVFINTGFLDRTGDEIHTNMNAGAFAPKKELKTRSWFEAYEAQNVSVGLSCGFKFKAQIGKGMWAIPDNMKDMMISKIEHPRSGATTAWVPSPTAATLHAVHYHLIDVHSQHKNVRDFDLEAYDSMLEIPLLGDTALSKDQIAHELDNNVQSILGYVVRWVDNGVGCSKVPDIENVSLMEDRATLRISSQHITNWLCHGICSGIEVECALQRMASVVDKQNEGDPAYRRMLENPSENLALMAARKLIMEGAAQPNGYTEPTLHHYRKRSKSLQYGRL